jgi:HEAT repeat protein
LNSDSLSDKISKLIQRYAESLSGDLDDPDFDPESDYEDIEVEAAELGAEAIPLLLKYAHSQNVVERGAALDLMRLIGDESYPTITEAALEALHDGDPELRDTALLTLIEVGDSRAVPILLDELQSTHGYALSMIAGGLGRLKDESAVPVLSELLTRKDLYPEMHYIVTALELIGTQEAINRIHDWKQTQQGQDYIDHMVAIRLEVLQTVQGADLKTHTTMIPEGGTTPETDQLWNDIAFRELTFALHIPMLNAQAVAILESMNTPEARQALSDWRYEQGLE